MIFCHASDHLELWNDYSICRHFISHRMAQAFFLDLDLMMMTKVGIR